MEEKGSFVFYRSWYDAISHLPDNLQLEAYQCIAEYGLTSQMPDLTKYSPMTRMVITLVAPIMEANHERWVNGRKGGRKRKSAQVEVQDLEQADPQTPQQPDSSAEEEELSTETEGSQDCENKKTIGFENKNQSETDGSEGLQNSETLCKCICTCKCKCKCKCNMSLSSRERVEGERETEFFKKLLFEKCARNPVEEYQRFMSYYESTGGLDKNGNKVVSYLAKLGTWEIKSEKDTLPRAHVNIWRKYCEDKFGSDIPQCLITGFRGFQSVTGGDYNLVIADGPLLNYFSEHKEEIQVLRKYIPNLKDIKWTRN